jgi:hypothetical protein
MSDARATHTPGPWRWDGKFTVTIPHPKGDCPFRVEPEDARLIAATPDLLAALRRAVETIHALHDIGLHGSPHAAAEMWALYQQSPEMRAINAALAKAEGRAAESA